MRIENNEEVPSTLGEYRDLCAIIGGEKCKAVQFLDNKIKESPKGRDEVVIAADSQMRIILYPMIV